MNIPDVNYSSTLIIEAVVVAVLVFLVYGLIVYIRLDILKQKARDELVTFLPMLNERYDLLTDLCACVKENKISEKKFTTAAIQRRDIARESTSPFAHVASENAFSAALMRLLIILRKEHRELRRDLWYVDTAKKLEKCSDALDEAAENYNSAVKSYNGLVEIWPSRYVAKHRGYKKIPAFMTWKETHNRVTGTAHAELSDKRRSLKLGENGKTKITKKEEHASKL